jgi:rubrerythrin
LEEFVDTVSVKSILETAVKAEDLGISFYTELARKFAGNDEIRSILEMLARDEVEHKRQFSELLRDVGEENYHLSQIDIDYIKSVDLSRHFDGLENVSSNIKPMAVLTRAYAFEKESVLFYTGLRDIIGRNPMLDEIIKIEKSHVTKLMKYVLDESHFRGMIDTW